jgi:hypothetical protein
MADPNWGDEVTRVGTYVFATTKALIPVRYHGGIRRKFEYVHGDAIP